MENLTNFSHYFLSFVFIISVIVFVHEFGHYYIAKICGVKIEAFSIGFGPEIIGWNDKSGTRWKIGVFPLGGYVKMFGDSSEASTPDKEKIKKLTKKQRLQTFHYKPLHQKAAIVAAGPAVNFIMAIIILAFFFSYYGKPHTLPEASQIIKGSAAEKAGLKPGDLILKLGGTNIERFEDIKTITSLNPEAPLELVYSRKGKEIKGIITPKLSESKDIFGNTVKIGLIGIASEKTGYKKYGIFSAVIEAVRETYNISATTLYALGQIITGKRNSDEISGILRIGKYSGQATSKGFTTVLWFMAVLSINLGLINLFPIPLLDGGHLMYYAVEAVKGKPIAEKYQQYGFRVGFALLIMLMAFATINDLKHFNIF